MNYSPNACPILRKRELEVLFCYENNDTSPDLLYLESVN